MSYKLPRDMVWSDDETTDFFVLVRWGHNERTSPIIFFKYLLVLLEKSNIWKCSVEYIHLKNIFSFQSSQNCLYSDLERRMAGMFLQSSTVSLFFKETTL